MKKTLIYCLLIIFCSSITYSSHSCNVSYASAEVKHSKEKLHLTDVDIHPLSIFSLRY